MQISFECEECGHFHKVDETKVGKRGRCRNCGAEVRVPVPGPVVDTEVVEESGSGAPVFRHQARPDGIQAPDSAGENCDAISAHVEEHIGPVHQVWHELISDLVHIDVLQVEPTDERPFWTLVTSGMSDRPMTVPPDAESYAHAELFLCLPPDWPMSRSDFQNENHYWPVRLLKSLGRLPQEYDTWLGPGHSVGNDGEELTPYAENTSFCCALVMPPLVCVSSDFHILALPDRQIRFYGVWPLHRDEAELKMEQGLDELLNRLEKSRITESVDVSRPSSRRRSGWKFW
jgi:hypothetical protein